MKANIILALEQNPLLPLFYHEDIDFLKEILSACHNAGITAFEFTNRGPKALEIFTELVAYKNQQMPTMALGIGTIFSVEQAQAYQKVETDFIVQPFVDEAVGQYCIQNNIDWLPGTMTFTEIHKAHRIGANIVKLFPGNIVGPDFLKAMKGPMPHAKILVTGGVEPTQSSISTWLNAGAYGLGLGSQLFNKEVTENRNIAYLELLLKECRSWVKG